MKDKLWKAIEAYRTAGCKVEHMARKEQLNILINEIVIENEDEWLGILRKYSTLRVENDRLKKELEGNRWENSNWKIE